MKDLSYSCTLPIRTGVWGREVCMTEEDPLVLKGPNEGSLKVQFKDKHYN